MSTPLPLPGLEADNLLAFLALLGTLSALEAREDTRRWRPRARWQGLPWRPVLELEGAPDSDEVAQEIDAGIAVLGAALKRELIQPNDPDKDNKPRANITYPPAEFRDILERAIDDPVQIRLLQALAADGVAKPDGKRVQATGLALIAGQGNMDFLSRVMALAQLPLVTQSAPAVAAGPGPADGAVAPARKGLGKDSRDKGKKGPGRGAKSAATPVPKTWEHLSEALFRPWQRSAAPKGLEMRWSALRWDPVEDRRYARMAGDPGGADVVTVPGANRLAVIGLMCLPVVPGPHGRLETSLMHRVRRPGERSRDIDVTWPIWREAAALEGILALLRHPELFRETPRREELEPLGVAEVMRAARISVGKFGAMLPAVPLWGTPAG